MQVEVINVQRKKVGTIDLPESIFGVDVNEVLLWEQVKAQRASRRRGTHKTKKRGEVSGGGIKPFKQKGTAQARQGSSRAPNHVGGGTVFGPVPRDYSYRLPRSARKAALCSALSLRAKDKAIVVLDQFALEVPKTKVVVEFLAGLGSTSALFVDAENGNLKLSARNVPDAKFVDVSGINVYDVLDHDKLIVTKAAIGEMTKRLADDAQRSAA